MIPIRRGSRPETLLHQVHWLLEHKPNATAIILRDGEREQAITYADFFMSAARYAHALEAAGVQSGDLVVLVLPHGESVVYGFWGALLIGAVPSIFPFLSDKLDRDRYFESVRRLIEHSRARVVIADVALAVPLRDHLAGLPSLAAIVNAERLEPGGDPNAYLSRPLPDANTTAFLQHSSGSTGLQKGVMLSHRAVINQIASYSEAIRLQPDDVIVSWLPLYHDMGLIAAFVLPIMQAIPLVLMSPFQWVREPQMMLHAITTHRGTLCWLPNFAYNFLAQRLRDSALEGVDLSSLRAVINCSEPVYADSHRAFCNRFAPYGLREHVLLTCYAMAENTFAVTQSAVGKPPRVDRVDRRALAETQIAQPVQGDTPTVEIVSCGTPIAGCDARVVGAGGEPLSDRRVGEIILHSDSMLSGYYRRPDLTSEAIRDGWYFTGDMGYLADGELYVTGRKKDLIIVSGKNVYPQDIENLLHDVPGVHPGRVVAFGVKNAQLGTEDVAVLVEANSADLLDDADAKAAISRTIRARVAQNTEVTARYVHVVAPKWLIKTSSGKIARAANRDKFLKELRIDGQG